MKSVRPATIRTDAPVLFAALRHPGVLYPARWRPASTRFVRWLQRRGVPAPIVDLYRQGTPSTYAQLGSGGLNPEKDVIRENDEYPNFLKVGMLIVGSMGNGDQIVVDFARGQGAAGYFSHEILWGSKELSGARIRRDFRMVAPSLGALVLGLVKGSVPMDYYWTWSEDVLPREQPKAKRKR